MDLMILAPLGMLAVMGLLAAIGLPGSRRSWEQPPQPVPGQLTPQARAALAQQQAPRAAMPAGMLPPPPPGYGYQPMPGGGLALVPLRGTR